jgi:hypothetical protein
LLKQQIELGALVNIILGDELEVGCHGHHMVRYRQILAICRKDDQCSQTHGFEETVDHEDHLEGDASLGSLKFQSSRR